MAIIFQEFWAKGTSGQKYNVMGGGLRFSLTKKIETKKPTATVPSAKNYSNARFKEVTVEKIGEHKFLIKGKGQIFEASFSWVVEDGHEELKKGFQMTDAGAPECRRPAVVSRLATDAGGRRRRLPGPARAPSLGTVKTKLEACTWSRLP